MLQLGRYQLKRAETDAEIEQIHRLNYRTFVEEIPQHASDEPGRLVDKFHHKNTYFVAVCEQQRVVGMISVHDQPPFSVASRLPDPRILERADRTRMEVRLLAVEPAHRGGPLMIGLLWMALDYALERYDEVYISGVTQRVPMYERLGFRPLGPAIADGAAAFVPMRVTFPLEERVARLAGQWKSRMRRLTGAVGNQAADEHRK
jgi:predicted N-acetyltransferase YhbS